MYDGGEEETLGSKEIAAHLAEEPEPDVEHFFVDGNQSNLEVLDEIGSFEPNVEALQSITSFLTLLSLTPPVTQNFGDPVLGFTRSRMLTSDKYVNAAEEHRQAKIRATEEKQ